MRGNRSGFETQPIAEWVQLLNDFKRLPEDSENLLVLLSARSIFADSSHRSIKTLTTFFITNVHLKCQWDSPALPILPYRTEVHERCGRPQKLGEDLTRTWQTRKTREESQENLVNIWGKTEGLSLYNRSLKLLSYTRTEFRNVVSRWGDYLQSRTNTTNTFRSDTTDSTQNSPMENCVLA